MHPRNAFFLESSDLPVLTLEVRILVISVLINFALLVVAMVTVGLKLQHCWDNKHALSCEIQQRSRRCFCLLRSQNKPMLSLINFFFQGKAFYDNDVFLFFLTH